MKTRDANQGTGVKPWAQSQSFIISRRFTNRSLNRGAWPSEGQSNTSTPQTPAGVTQSSSRLRPLRPSSRSPPPPLPPSLARKDLWDHVGPPAEDGSRRSLSTKPRTKKIQQAPAPGDRGQRRKSPPLWSTTCGLKHTVNIPREQTQRPRKAVGTRLGEGGEPRGHESHRDFPEVCREE